jgi:hypothetical protein
MCPTETALDFGRVAEENFPAEALESGQDTPHPITGASG